jgi:hypothetical protein
LAWLLMQKIGVMVIKLAVLLEIMC